VITGSVIKLLSGFAIKRSMPKISKVTLENWFQKNYTSINKNGNKKVYLFCDEFTNYNDAEIGIKGILLLEKLGYEVLLPKQVESGRAWLSKGLLRKAQKIANQNIELLGGIVTSEIPLIGIEPSAILTFRDEYPDLAYDQNLVAASANNSGQLTLSLLETLIT
jgi:Fe-S oxidoreductase